MRLAVRLRRGPAWLLIAIPVLLYPSGLAAQTITDPRTVEFMPSAQHDDSTPEGVPIVSSYSLSIYPAGQGTPAQTVNLGKPAPGSDGMIRVDFVSRLTTPLATGVSYQARVTATGPGGSASSNVSNPFSFASPCTYKLVSTQHSLTAAGGNASVGVIAPTGCTWGAIESSTWISITSAAHGSGSGTVAFTATPNTTTAARSAAITVAGQKFTVTQTAGSCTFTVTPAKATVVAAGGSVLVNVTASLASCNWTASSSVGWITAAGTSRTGSRTFTYTVAKNTGTERRATVTIAGRSMTITQSAGNVPSAPTNLRIVK
jgi:hypothetical protein